MQNTFKIIPFLTIPNFPIGKVDEPSFGVGTFDMKLIPLYKGYRNQHVDRTTPCGLFAMIDDEDYDYLMQWKWQAIKSPTTYYAFRKETFTKLTIYMARTIMTVVDSSVFVDHKDRNGLNNQKTNLRKCSQGQNCLNTPPRPGDSKYKGVCIRRKAGSDLKYWYVQITMGGKKQYVGIFPYTPEGEIEAAKAYDKKALELHGEFAYLNFKEDYEK